MPAYTGPVPPTPTATSTDAQWQSWWTYQTILQNMRYEDERAAAAAAAVARAVVLDRQHAEKMAAEAACAAATQALAAAQAAGAAALGQPTPVRLPTKAELAFELVKVQPQATIMTNSTLISGAAGIVEAYAARYPNAVSG